MTAQVKVKATIRQHKAHEMKASIVLLLFLTKFQAITVADPIMKSPLIIVKAAVDLTPTSLANREARSVDEYGLPVSEYVAPT